MKLRNTSNSGMTLIEALAYVAILAVVINGAMSMFLGASRLSFLGTAAADRLSEVERVREAFTGAVHEAQGIAPGAGAFRTGPDCLVLDMPVDPADGAPRYVVLGCLTSKTGLMRVEVTARDGQYVTESAMRFALPVAALHFAYDGAAPLVTLDLDAVNASKDPSRPPVTYRFAAAPRSRSGKPLSDQSDASDTSDRSDGSDKPATTPEEKP